MVMYAGTGWVFIVQSFIFCKILQKNVLENTQVTGLLQRGASYRVATIAITDVQNTEHK
jgi:drug/metabolite transporter superfamily protein YnfA